MTRQDVEEKFLGLAAPVLGEEKARAVVEELQTLDDAGIDDAPLLAALARISE